MKMTVIGSNIHATDHFIRAKDTYQQERILLTKGPQYLANAEPEAENGRTAGRSDQVSISKEAKDLQEEMLPVAGIKTHQGRECCRLALLRNLVERFTGKSAPILSSEEIPNTDLNPVTNEILAEEVETPALPEALTLALEYRKTETVSFSATGNFLTADGQEVGFNLEMNFSRQILAEKALSVNFAEAMSQPLNIQYDGFASQITQTSFSFTLDCCKPGEEITLEDSPQAETAKPAEIAAESKVEENTDVAAAEETETTPVDAEEEASSIDANSFFERLRIWAKDRDENHPPVMFGVKGVGVIFHEDKGMEFTLKKLGHFMNKMAKAVDRFSQSQQIAGHEETPAVSNQA
jgi:hypothetical protein